MAVKIITDAACDLTQAQAQQKGILFVPMTITFGQTEYKAGVNISNEEFYTLLANSEALPTTSQPTPYEFEQVYQAVTEQGDEAVVICMSSALSGTFQSACIAAADFENIQVVDSLNVTIGQRILLEYALTLVAEGLNARQIADKLNQAKSNIRIYAAVDTLEYLMKGGRLSKTAGLAGKVLGIRPILTVEGGELKVIAKARGIKGAINQLNQIIAGNINTSLPYMLGYSGTDRSNLDDYLAASAEIWGCAASEEIISEIGSTIGTHTGPGLIVMAYFTNQ